MEGSDVALEALPGLDAGEAIESYQVRSYRVRLFSSACS